MIKYWERKAVKAEKEFTEIRNHSIWYGKKYKAWIEVPAAAVGIVLLLVASEYLGPTTTNDYCIECIADGTLKRYAQVRKEQHKILINSEEAEVIIPEMEAPYPLLNMPVTDSASYSRNIDRAKYYGKTSVIAEMVE